MPTIRALYMTLYGNKDSSFHPNDRVDVTNLPARWLESQARYAHVHPGVMASFYLRALIVDVEMQELQNNDSPRIRKISELHPPLIVFSCAHEAWHLFNFRLVRDITRRIDDATAELFTLLEAPFASSHFWNDFQRLNQRLAEYVERLAVFDEIRATLSGMAYVSDEAQDVVWNELVTQTEQQTPEGQLLSTLSRLHRQFGLDRAMGITFLAELLDASNPLRGLEEIERRLAGEDSQQWTEEAWQRWWSQWDEEFDNWDKTEEVQISVSPAGFTEFGPLVWIICYDGFETTTISILHERYGEMNVHAHPGQVRHSEKLVDGRRPVFLESIRQQLAALAAGIKADRLHCPFYERNRQCCGLGEKLSLIWGAIPREELPKATKPIHTQCVKSKT